ncbi:MAG: flagella basal body P-ring formation protein FlgA [Pseudohongiellaceae bacterium]|jgi:flagella basal body P-ring formation protein FlgA
MIYRFCARKQTLGLPPVQVKIKKTAQCLNQPYTVTMSIHSDKVLNELSKKSCQMVRTLQTLAFLTVLGANSSAVAEQGVIAQITNEVEQFLEDFHAGRLQPEHRIEIIVGYIDPRLNLPGCPSSLQLELNGNQQGIGKLQVKASCAGDRPWTKYVAAEVNLFGNVLVATENIRRGTAIEERHMRLMETNIATLRRTPVADQDLVIGMELKYPLTTGSAFSLDSLTRPLLVQRGDLVQLVAESKNLRIRQQGEALQDGALGKVINVRNNSSEMIVQAEVIGSGKVKVQL